MPLALSAINEPLDLQALITSIGSTEAHTWGWYDERREVQHAFVLALALVGIVSAVFMQRLTIHADPLLKVTFAGLALTGIFVVLRAASIEHLDEAFNGIAHGFSWAWLAEMVRIMSVAAGSRLHLANR